MVWYDEEKGMSIGKLSAITDHVPLQYAKVRTPPHFLGSTPFGR